MSVSIGDVKIGDEPKIVAVVSGNKALSLAGEAESEGADILEIRTDLFNHGYETSEIIKTFQSVKRKTRLPLLITIRRLEEGGLYYTFQNSENKRFEIFSSVMGHVKAVDIELNAEIRDRVIREAREHNVIPIVSYHNFYETPPLKDLMKIAGQAYELDSEIVKIAVMANDKDDVITLFKLLLEFNKKYKKPITAIAMSNIGAISRVAFPFYKSCLTYGFVSEDKANAPGQLTVKMLRGFLDKYKNEIPKIRSNLPTILRNISSISERLAAAI